jgi:hypothetical protein
MNNTVQRRAGSERVVHLFRATCGQPHGVGDRTGIISNYEIQPPHWWRICFQTPCVF